MQNVLINPSEERRILDFRPLGFRDVLVLGKYSYTRAHSPLEIHSHGNMLEICYLASGRQTYVVQGKRHHLSGGDIFVTFPGEQHGSGSAPEGKGMLYWMIIEMPLRNTKFLSLPAGEGRLMMDHLLDLPQRQFRGTPAMKNTLAKVFETFDFLKGSLRRIELRNLLQRFLLDLIKLPRTQCSEISSTIAGVQHYIAENLDKSLTLHQLAKQAHLSSSRLKTRFKNETGIPPADYVMRQRIEHGKVLLQSTSTNVTGIAMRLGFATPQYFATVFKRYTSQTPLEYRKAMFADNTRTL